MQHSQLNWFTSSYSSAEGGQCVEVAVEPAVAVHVRDSKDRRGPALTFSPDAWAAFIALAVDRPL